MGQEIAGYALLALGSVVGLATVIIWTRAQGTPRETSKLQRLVIHSTVASIAALFFGICLLVVSGYSETQFEEVFSWVLLAALCYGGAFVLFVAAYGLSKLFKA